MAVVPPWSPVSAIDRGAAGAPSKFEVFSKTHVFSNEFSLLLPLTPVKIFDFSNFAGKAQKRITLLALKVNCIPI